MYKKSLEIINGKEEEVFESEKYGTRSYFRDSQTAFNDAIESQNCEEINKETVVDYMYMNTNLTLGRDEFKHMEFRHYVFNPITISYTVTVTPTINTQSHILKVYKEKQIESSKHTSLYI